MRFAASMMALSLAPLLATATAQAQAAGGHPMTLDVTVSSHKSVSVPGLREADFKLLDDKHAEPITSFHVLDGPEAHTSVILVLDALNLPYTRVTYARQEIERFLNASGAALPQPTSLAVLTDHGIAMQPGLTTNAQALRSSLDKYSISLRSIPRSTGFYGAQERLQISLDSFRLLIGAAERQPGRKLIVWVGAGWPLLSGPEVRLSSNQQQQIFSQIVALSTEMRTGQITLDAVNPLGAEASVLELNYYEEFVKGVRDPGHVDIADLGLQVLAEQSGGDVLNGSNDISALLKQCYDQRQTVYELSFDAAPGEHTNEYHQIQVQLTDRSLTAHTRTGYYADPSYPPLTAVKTPEVVNSR